MKGFQLIFKRVFDVASSGLAILLLCPFWAIVVLLMKCTMPGPVFFKQERIGRHFVPFRVLKFRTMKVDRDAERNFRIEKDAERVTPLGRFLRRVKLDETPQLLNVLKGDMSVVGPRPTVRQRVEEYPDGQDVRLSMRPGLTGMSQVSGNVLLSWPRRIEYDCRYVRGFSLWLDAKIILKTLAVIILGEDRFISREDWEHYQNPIYAAKHSPPKGVSR
jgi:lipopolysaccharide/colanic/teichoic acid biosynthesis glycosyltransferase